MNSVDCGHVRDAIPGLARRLELGAAARGPRSRSEMPALEAHLAGCPECRAELELARALLQARPRAPEGLQGRILQRLRRERESARHPVWALTAAAVAALALGIGLHEGAPDPVAPAFAQEPGESASWDPEDGLVAGAPVLDDLTDQDLTVLLAALDGGDD